MSVIKTTIMCFHLASYGWAITRMLLTYTLALSRQASLLAMPSNDRGLICPNELVDRYIRKVALEEETPIFEMALSLFRLDKRIQPDTSKLDKGKNEEFLKCILYVYGNSVEFVIK
jgi:hypothetical protein